MLRPVAFLLLIFFAAKFAHAADPPASPAPTPPDYTQKSWHRKLVELHNAARKEKSAAPLTADVLLAQAAQVHADHMAQTGKFAHDEIGDGDVTTRLEATGYKGMRWGENIAWGATTPEKAHEIWMESEPHREQLLTPAYTEVGFGACKARDGKVYWVAVFGTPR